jgi:hypothetical protein
MALKARPLLIALLASALTALTPPAAGAAFFNFESIPVTVKGKAQGNHVLDLAGGTLSCEEFKLEGVSTALTQSALLFTVSYGGCTMFGVKATVSTGKCQLELRNDGRFFLGPNGVECNASPMTVDATVLTKKCHIALASQILEKAVTYGNSGTGSSREVTMAISAGTGVFYKAEGELCKETGSKTNGSYTSGPATLTAERESWMFGMWWV